MRASDHSFDAVAGDLLSAGLAVRFRAGGRSMQPAVRDGECVTVVPVRLDDIALGDILLCETWRGPLAHRVRRIARAADGERRFVLQGDASAEPDRLVEGRQVCGRLVGVERDGRLRSLAVAGGALGRRLTVARLSLSLRPLREAAAGLWAAARRYADAAS